MSIEIATRQYLDGFITFAHYQAIVATLYGKV